VNLIELKGRVSKNAAMTTETKMQMLEMCGGRISW